MSEEEDLFLKAEYFLIVCVSFIFEQKESSLWSKFLCFMLINCRGTLLDLSTPKIMGILNLTPDSFFDGGKYKGKDKIMKRVEEMISEGMDLIDVGGMSSRPGAELIPVQEELDRVLPIIEWIRSDFPDLLISVDTIRSKVAKEVIERGAHIINDISGGNLDPKMLETVGAYNVPYVLMHMKGTPASMQEAPVYEDLLLEVFDYLLAKIDACKKANIKDVIVDPGFGFGKTIPHNYTLLRNLQEFARLDCPILVGLSRKSMIYKVLGGDASTALNGTTALHMMALENGANLLRVHDVKAAKEALILWQTLNDNA